MKNLFSQNNINHLILNYKKKGISKDLAERIYTSRLLGSNHELVLHGGGNTSVKSTIKDIDGINYDIIYVKGSGSDLESIEPSGFPALKISSLLKIMNKKIVTDEEMVSYLRKNLIENNSPNPSVETLVHALIKEKFVDHTHSTSILEITNRPNGLKLCKELYGNNFVIIPYVMPGYQLARKVSALYKSKKELHGLILFRHGIFTFGDTAKSSYDRMINNVNIAEKFLKKEKIRKLTKIQSKKINFKISDINNLLNKYICNHRSYIINFRSSKTLLSQINSKNLRTYLSKGVVTPDHVIRTKPKPLILNIDKCKNLNDVAVKIKKEISLYKLDYLKYFKKYNNKKKSFKILDSVPSIVIVQNLGMFSVGRNHRESVINGDVSEMSIKTILRIEERSKFLSITEKDIFDVEYWSLEQAKLNKNEKSLVGKVVLITGGAGTIGLATAKKFTENGAEVILLDKDKIKIKNLINSSQFKCYLCDVTNRNSFSRIVSKICIEYGSIDIVVSNAGSAFQSAIGDISDNDLQNSFNINFFSHQIVASETVKIMKNQGQPGCLLFNISKQAINPGKNFGAYGTSKAALLALCKQYALEYGSYGIRSNGVNADRIRSGLLTREMIKERAKSRNTTVEKYIKNNLLNKEVLPSDVAEAFYHLAISKKTTAAIYTVDGGNIEASLR